MPLKTYPFDGSKYVDGTEAEAELLADAFESGDAGYILHAFGIVARARGMESLAREAGVSRSALYKALEDDEKPDLDTLRKIADVLTANAGGEVGKQSPPAAAE